jgi:hypothetical protein
MFNHDQYASQTPNPSPTSNFSFQPAAANLQQLPNFSQTFGFSNQFENHQYPFNTIHNPFGSIFPLQNGSSLQIPSQIVPTQNGAIYGNNVFNYQAFLGQ